MATDAVPPAPDADRTNLLSEEKAEKSSIRIAEPVVAEVYADVREIDLDETGKERPIVTEVDAATRLISLEDDPTLPVFTFRMWFLGLGLGCFGAVLGQIFYFRPQPVGVSPLFLQLLGYLLGITMQEIIPGPGNQRYGLTTPDNAFWRFMNPGPFNIKEHVAITILATTASGSALAVTIFAVDDLYYNVQPNVAVAIFTLIGSQLIGYSLGGMFPFLSRFLTRSLFSTGIMRAFLVYPTYMIFPNVFPPCQLFEALHHGKKMLLQKKRVRFFRWCFIAIFIWEWFPEFIAPTLTGISVFCLAKRDSPWFTRIFGGATGNEGLGLLSLCLDWNYISGPHLSFCTIGALFTPLSTQLSVYFGIVLCMIAFCAVYANNVWEAQRFPWLSQGLFYENGTRYNQLSILDANFRLDKAALERQGLPWLAGTQVLARIGVSLSIGATITHVIIWYGKDIIESIRRYRAGEAYDAHLEKMKAYPEVPMWWTFIGTFGMSMATIYTGNSGMPGWGLVVAILIAAMFLPFVATVYAITGYVTNMSSLVQILGASLMPGSPQVNMYFTLYGFSTVEQALALVQDLKRQQYMKIPPRVTFTIQASGAIVGGLLNYVIMKVIISTHREVLLDVQGSNVWSGLEIQAFNAEAVSWGALGNILYAPSGRYAIVPFSILIGLAVPLPFWLAHRFFPTLGANRVITPIICSALGWCSGRINSSTFTLFLLGIFSQYYLRRYRPRWFRKYNYLLSAALDGGTQVMIFVFTFAVGGGSGKVVNMPHWALNPIGNPDYCMRLAR
ncbi:peptide transporter MTD1 [Mycena rosella]|uniref:Peptide transporter MTD1 n=1 Tax=Mycena rosella TaxID=1033263 RepID=A0AAD7C9M2_MYCRO|nr:peptide transporter MTD1 [Mycena rosella]